jgi:dipeptidase E
MSETRPAAQIVAMGGGGFSSESGSSLLDDFVLSLVRDRAHGLPRVCLVPTASGETATYLVHFYRSFSGRAIASDLTLFGNPSLPRRPARTADIGAFLAEQDVIYVGGGNTVNLLAVWRAHGVDRALADAWRAGTVLCGVSAGMICWFEAGITDSFGGGVAPLPDGLGLLPGSACPHYDTEAERRPTYHRVVAEGFPAGYAADDGAALHFVGTRLEGAVSSRRGAGVYRVEMRNGQVVEERVAVRHLGA